MWTQPISRFENNFQPSGKPIEQAGPAWSKGCDLCKYGVLPSTPPLNNRLPLWEQRVAQQEMGLLDVCGCQAGQAIAKMVMVRIDKFVDVDVAVATMKDEYAKRRHQQLFDEAGVPARYKGYTLAGFPGRGDPGKTAAISAITSLYKTGFANGKPGLLLWGAPGVGKTGMLSPFITAKLAAGHSVLWVQYNELMRQMRDFQSGLTEAREAHCKAVDFLMIDDLGDPTASKVATDYSREVLFRIINHRYDNEKVLLVTSNLTPAQIDAQFHARINRRIGDICAVVEVGGKVL